MKNNPPKVGDSKSQVAKKTLGEETKDSYKNQSRFPAGKRQQKTMIIVSVIRCFTYDSKNFSTDLKSHLILSKNYSFFPLSLTLRKRDKYFLQSLHNSISFR